MKRTNEQAWYKAASRRPRLLYRRTALILHTKVDYPAPIEKDCTSAITLLTPDEKFSVTLEKGFKIPSSLTRGQSFPVKQVKNTPEQLTAISENYVTIAIDGLIFAVDYDSEKSGDTVSLIYLCKTTDLSPYTFKDWLILDPKDIENYPSGPAIVTTYGRYFVNYYLIASTFLKDVPTDYKIPEELLFVNADWNTKKFEASLSTLLMEKKIQVDSCDKYIDHGYFISGFGEICGVTITPKAITPNRELIKRRDELLKQYKDQLNDPRIMTIIDNELIAMDKDSLKDDPSMDFFANQSKVFTVERKRQYSAMGTVEDFGSARGNYVYIEGSLSEGAKPKDFEKMMNEARKGFYGRAVETQVAGVDTKLMIQVFQNCKITAEDCGTKRCLEITINPDIAKSFLDQFVEVSPGKYEPLTRDNINKYLGKPVRLRSFMFCEQKDGFCMKCAGNKFKDLDYRNPGVLTIDVGAVFMAMSMKSMHGIKIDSLELASLDDYVVNP